MRQLSLNERTPMVSSLTLFHYVLKSRVIFRWYLNKQNYIPKMYFPATATGEYIEMNRGYVHSGIYRSLNCRSLISLKQEKEIFLSHINTTVVKGRYKVSHFTWNKNIILLVKRFKWVEAMCNQWYKGHCSKGHSFHWQFSKKSLLF